MAEFSAARALSWREGTQRTHLCATGDPAPLGPGLTRRPGPVGDAEDPHRLQPEAQLLAAVRRADVQAGELADALEAVPDRVAVREEPLRGPGDVAVGVEERLDGLQEVR